MLSKKLDKISIHSKCTLQMYFLLIPQVCPLSLLQLEATHTSLSESARSTSFPAINGEVSLLSIKLASSQELPCSSPGGLIAFAERKELGRA